jgi:hypothetical protein
MDFWAKDLAGEALPDGKYWPSITSAVDVAAKVC